MFIIRQYYKSERLGKDSFKTAEEAISAAIAEAELDNEGYTHVVAEVHTVIKPNPVKHPVKIYDAVQATALLEDKKNEESE